MQRSETASTSANSQNENRSPLPGIGESRRSRSRSRNTSMRKKKTKPRDKRHDADNQNNIASRNDKELRRSPRRQNSITHAQIVKDVILPTSMPSNPNFTNYKIPRKPTNCDNQVKAEATISKSNSNSVGEDGQQKAIGVKSLQTTITDQVVENPFVQNAKNIHKSSFMAMSATTIKQRKSGHSKNYEAARTLPEDGDMQRKNRQTPLQAKRRLPQTSTDPDIKTIKIDTLLQKSNDAKFSAQQNKTYEDLPDYEDSVSDNEVGDEDMEMSNAIPSILKMVKDSHNNVTQPQNPIALDVTAMDVDIDLPVVQPQAEQIIIVPDTNIWINDLRLIETMLKKEFSKPVLIVIPWMVLQELDVNIHQNSKHSQSFMKMKKPIQYIHSLLASNHPRVKGQKAFEAAISKLKFDELVADDSILNCVFQNLKSHNTVIFLSNDKNLLNKALVHGINSADSNNALKKLNDVLKGSKSDMSSPSSLSVSFSPTLPFAPENSPNAANITMKRELESSDSSSDSLDYILGNDVEMQEDSEPNSPLCKVRAVGQLFSSAKPESKFHLFENALVKAFSYIIRRKMIEDYGMGGWEYALKVKPPWTLSNAIKCMLVHWIANFSFVFTRRGQSHLEKLKRLVENYKYSQIASRKSLEEQIIDSSISLFNFLDKDFENEDTVVECKRVLLARSLLDN